MKAYRAYIASLGTSGVLIGSFLLLLAIVSAIFAFRGYPGEATGDGLDRLDVRQTRPAAAVSRAERVVGDAPRDRSGTGDRTAARGAVRGERAAGQGVGGSGVEGVRSEGGVTGGGAGDGAAPGGGGGGGNELPRLPVDPGGGGELPQPPSVEDVTGGLGGAVDDATGGLGGAVGRTAPPLEAPVQEAGEAVGGVLEQSAPAVDDVVGGVTDQVGDVTGGLTSGDN